MKKNNTSKLTGFLIVFAAVIFTSMIIVDYINTIDLVISTKSKPAEILGQKGDYFGGMLNPVFAFSSFIALLVTIHIQTKELKASKEQLILSNRELELTRKELKDSAIAMKRQAEHFEKQSRKDDLRYMISTVYSHVDEILNSKIKDFNFVNTIVGESKEYSNFIRVKESLEKNDIIGKLCLPTLVRLTVAITEIDFYISKYDSIDEFDVNQVTLFYRNRIEPIRKDLIDLGLLEEITDLDDSTFLNHPF